MELLLKRLGAVCRYPKRMSEKLQGFSAFNRY